MSVAFARLAGGSAGLTTLLSSLVASVLIGFMLGTALMVRCCFASFFPLYLFISFIYFGIALGGRSNISRYEITLMEYGSLITKLIFYSYYLIS